ncbi:hypothetical protein Pmar_PMAR008801 [Perkinsus marinus ATCC 50983]|uniref:Serine carboxypeptidase n=1 Tax=Perkinsus marinus (strain ATCC 50983 / TXsc) TaxID=423536 RepID=C5L120_PERM5|nr:hypothetical protein Pmar_PMAR008801 [Perkinsus marinus ATCC 50983]EER09662.1 hypothetical protein Pmar_PMAR008801 [Perkinsus marinus ATCC 50983]|eukprot:XP_002777867.1 hypothetical protein Pmar_PMAR008801 [Perkinsus marinus ATCC 50983]
MSAVLPLLRYYYAALEAESDPKTAPTFLFFPGGFGSSGVAYALSRGPCILLPGSNKPGLNLSEESVYIASDTRSRYSWSRKANSIWIDAPGPTGFSLGPIEKDLGAFVENM